jgi:hypothetical protein
MSPSRLRAPFSFVVVFILLGCAAAPPHRADPETARIARAYGIREFDRIEAIRYTFNVRLPDREIARSWIWEPGPDRVTFAGADENAEPITYLRNERDPAGPKPDPQIDAWFVNDNFWLLFPFHIQWTPDLTVDSAENQPLPLSEGRARRVTVRFPANRGYTPGDAYDLYLDPDHRIAQWVYRKGGAETPARAATWENHAKAGPILLALDHRGEGGFRVRFTDVAVRLKGSADWLPALIL